MLGMVTGEGIVFMEFCLGFLNLMISGSHFQMNFHLNPGDSGYDSLNGTTHNTKSG